MPSLLFLASGLTLVSGYAARNTSPYSCLPGQTCWPTSTQWADFNRTLGGALQITVPLASSCYGNSTSYDAAACAILEPAYGNSGVRADNYGNTQNLQWETCGAAQCQLNTLAPEAPPVAGTCSLGSLSAYFVNATSVDHVKATIAFTKLYNIRLSIKNSGHDYLGRSVTANSLALWTRHIQNYEFHAQFTATSCAASNADNVAVIGAGVNAGEAMQYFIKQGMDVTVGAVHTVAIAGGFGMGGGHGVFGPRYGLMVDQALEFDVVTADGIFRTINACNAPDLFWAMRGGGGGTYAVMINYKFKVHPAQKVSMYGFRATISSSAQVANLSQSQIYPAVFDAIVNNQTIWSKNNISGYNFFDASTIETYQIVSTSKPLSDLQQLTAQWAKLLGGLPGITIIQNNYTQFDNYPAYVASTGGIEKRHGPVAFDTIESTRLLPDTLFAAGNNGALKKALLDGCSQAFAANVALQVYATTPYNQPDNSATGLNPAWRGALWGAYYVGGYIKGTPDSSVSALLSAAQTAIGSLKALTPGGGCYTNEADPHEADWQTTFFGANYNKLLGVKNKYDPGNFFNCYKCVGWNGMADPMYSCYGSSPFATVVMPS